MRCPFCQHEETQVTDSRHAKNDNQVRRRRQCKKCSGKFTTFERVYLRDLSIAKSDGKLQPFDLVKLTRSIRIACRKRPIKETEIERLAADIQQHMEKTGESEFGSKTLGEIVMVHLARLDHVAYVRFASVYHDFNDVHDFTHLIEGLSAKSETS